MGVFREILASLPACVYAIRPETDRRVEFISLPIRELTGFAPAVFQGPHGLLFETLIHVEDRVGVAHAVARALARKESYSLEYRILTAKREIRWVSDRARPLFDEGGRIRRLVGTLLDITDQQTARLTSSRLASLGQMAGGIAHEINGPLTALYATANQLRARAEAGHADPARTAAGAARIEATSLQISKIIRGLRSFARDAEGDPFESCALQPILEDCAELCRSRFLAHGVTLQMPSIEAPLLLECRPAQVAQVLVNLLNNAFDAVREQHDKWVRIDVEVRGDSVMISVIDSGPGIDPAIRHRVMEPFFTTKKAANGTGLGLSISHALVDSHGGRLFVDEGSPNTCLRIELPRTQPAALSA